MTRQQLIQQIFEKKSFLCVGLDPDLKKIPPHILESARQEMDGDEENNSAERFQGRRGKRKAVETK